VAQIIQSADYTDRDLAALRLRFRTLIRSVFPAWTDFSQANFGNLLLDLYAWSADVLAFAQDAQAAEAFLPTAIQRRSLLKLAALVGYTPKGAGAASTGITFTATGLSNNCTIPAGTIIKTLSQESPIEFQTLSPLLLTPGSPSGTVTAENSKTVTESFASTGQSNFSITLGHTPYLDASLTLSTAQGSFTEVSSFVNSLASDRVFVVKVDDNDKATVIFGDGVVAGLPPTGTISATYKTGGGAVGNAAAFSIQSIEGTLLDSLGGLVNMACNNTDAAGGGTDRESADAIRQNAPASLTAPSVSVARTDFEVHARAVPGIDRALYITSNEDVAVPVNTGYLYLVAPGNTGPVYPDQLHIDRVRRQFQSDETPPFPMMASQALLVQAAPFIDVDVTATVFLKRNAVPATVGAAIRASLAALFATKTTAVDGTISNNALIDFGYYLRVQQSANALAPIGLLAASDIENAIRDTVGVREVGPNPADLTFVATRRVSGAGDVVTQVSGRQDIQVEHGSTGGPPACANFPRLGTVVLTDGDTLIAF
jgi:hypothetical protein